jgi:hypothetical protein
MSLVFKDSIFDAQPLRTADHGCGGGQNLSRIVIRDVSIAGRIGLFRKPSNAEGNGQPDEEHVRQ